MLNKILYIIATLGFIGFMPIAPGTFGSAVACLFVALLPLSDTGILAVFLPLFLIGIAASHSAEPVLGKDSGHIVIDEFCGYLISVAFLPRTVEIFIATFLLFRLFDIIKPPPIRLIERYVPGGAGIMLDDLLAGVYSNLCLQIWIYSK